MRTLRPHLLFLTNGPTFTLPTPTKFSALSKNYYGALITSCIDRKIKNQKNYFAFRLIAITYNFGRSIRFVRIRLKLFLRIRLLLTAMIYGLHCKIIGNPVDIIITADPIRMGMLGVFLSRLLRARLIVEVNGVHTSTDVLSDTQNPISRYLRGNLYPIIASWVLAHAHCIKTLFSTQLDPFKNKIIKNKPVHSFPNYVEIEPFLKIDDPGEKQILLIGHPFYLKGADLLIEAFRQISSEFPDWTLKLLGHFPDKEIVEKHVQNHPKITTFKPVFYPEIPSVIAGCSIFVLPSRTEAMGRVLIEAAAAGKARIGANVDGIPTVINHGIDGLLFEKGNARDLADKLKTLMSSDKLRAAYGKAAKQRAITEFSEKKYIQNLSALFMEALGQ